MFDFSVSASTSGILIFKVDITWDETDHERVTSLSRTFNKEELLDMDFQAYLASSSEEEEEEQQGTLMLSTKSLAAVFGTQVIYICKFPVFRKGFEYCCLS